MRGDGLGMGMHFSFLHLHFSFLIPHFSFKTKKVMSKKNNAKREAWQKKQEAKGKNVMKWIFGVLIVLAIIYLVWTFSIIA